MLTKVYSYGISALEALAVTIEVDVSSGLPMTNIVGLPDNAIKESKERVRSAIRNSGFQLPPRRVTINLSPADVKKEGPSFDLAIALGILNSQGLICPQGLDQYLVLGELSLDGKIQPIRGALSIALSCPADRFKGIILPWANAREAAVVKRVPIYAFATLFEVVQFLNEPSEKYLYKTNGSPAVKPSDPCDIDFRDVKGQGFVKRGLEIAATGGHNVLLIGPPGSGKSMLAKRLPTILPDMTMEECLETTKIHSVMGLLDNHQSLVSQRPFRSPHHTSSDVAIVGGGSAPRPGEVTLSHNGVLFLDELPEFNRNVLESLRQPLEDRHVTISRATKSVRFPCQFMLVAAMNPCPCGRFMNTKKQCQCTHNQIQKYLSKISGPLLDRIDLHLEVPALPSADLTHYQPGESSEAIKKRTTQGRLIQHERFRDSNIYANAQMTHKQIKAFCPLTDEGHSLLQSAIEDLDLSARAYDKIIKIARTIADLEAQEVILPRHIAEAIQYRCLDRDWWG